jgi:pilin isopeptide linkage protein
MCLKNLRKRAVSLGLAVLLLIGVFPFQTFATDRAALNTVRFQVRLEFTGDEPTKDASFYFDLEAVDEDAPLPENPEENCSVVVTSADVEQLEENAEESGEQLGNISLSALFEPIKFDTTGEYHYKITMRSDDFPANYTHDATVYDVTVKVAELTSGDLLAYYIAYLENGTDKQDDILFTTKYTKPRTPAATITPAGDPDPEEEEEPEEEEPPAEVDPSSNDDLNSNGKPDPFGDPNDSEEPMSPEKNSSSNSPKTGDTTNDLPWVVVLCAVIIGMFICLRYLDVLRKRDEEQGNQRHHHHGA